MTIDKEFLDILACTACKTAVTVQGERIVCTNPRCGLKFPIREGIPVMLVEEAERPH